MPVLSPTPYDGSARAFTIGLTRIEPSRWIEPDDGLASYLDEKSSILREHRDTVLMVDPQTRDSQQELLSLLCEHLTGQFPDRYRLTGPTMDLGNGRSVDLDSDPPLLAAGLLIQDDLLILRRRENGWSLAAAFVAFPSSWSLPEKFGRTMDEIHAPVPGFEGGTRNASLINRMFDNLAPGLVLERFNWAVNVGGGLYLPKSKSEATTADPVPITAGNAYIRVERQTLRRLPGTGDLVFAVRIYSDPLAVLASHDRPAELARAFAAELKALTLPEAAYKGLVSKREALLSALSTWESP